MASYADDEICFMPAAELARGIACLDLSPVEVVDAFLRRIEAKNPKLNAYITLLEDQARHAAREAERALTSGAALGPLHGVPVAIKDLFDYKAGVRNTFGSKVFVDYVPNVTTTYVERIERAGAIILGKTNVPEFGHKGITDNLLLGPTSTPFKPGKNAGGSSGGSAAAVAAGLAAVAQGTDGGGSIRIPASFCGVYGFKASYGRVAAAGRPNAFGSHTPFIFSGPLARTVEDAALLLQVMAGPHPRDPFSLPDDGTDYIAATRKGARGLKIAYSPNLDVFPVDARVAAVVDEAVKTFEGVGARVERVKIGIRRPQQELSTLFWQELGVQYGEMAESFKREGTDLLGSRRDELTPEFAALLESVQSIRAIDYRVGDWMRTEVFDAFQDVFETYDLVVSPTLAVPPVDNAGDGNTLGPRRINGEEVDPLVGWCLTYPVNFTGHPAASIPAGLTAEGLPVGMQIVGRRFHDATVLAASAALERVRPWRHTYPR
jgi:amidase/aspartyl-tRNA(Asn)/glutamyl-tRNA(Gln) amidotransferase subunit A